METQQEPVLWALGRARYTDLVLTFPLVTEDPETPGQSVWNTNWPKQPVLTLPLFLDNVLSQLGRFLEYEDAHRPGLPKTLNPPAAVNEVEVRRSEPGDGAAPAERLKRRPGAELVFGPPDRVGLYDVTWDDAVQYRFAVDLFDAEESNIQPRDDLQIGEEEVKKAEQAVRRRQELWPWFVLAALGLLFAEWYLYNRRISV
jgi:hypothetical protein